MDKPQLEITYRNGRPAKAYLTLPRRSDDRTVRTIPHGTLVVDYAGDGRPIGIEIESISKQTIPRLRELLQELGVKGVQPNDIAALGL
jgi:hypothetical protein